MEARILSQDSKRMLAWKYIPLALDRCSQIVRKVTKGWQRKSCRSA